MPIVSRFPAATCFDGTGRLVVRTDNRDGTHTITEAASNIPNVKALVSSGYSTDPVLADFRRFGFQGVVQKPYVLEDLSKALYDVLNKPSGPY